MEISLSPFSSCLVLLGGVLSNAHYLLSLMRNGQETFQPPERLLIICIWLKYFLKKITQCGK